MVQKVRWLIDVWDCMGLTEKQESRDLRSGCWTSNVAMEGLGPGTPALPLTSCFFDRLLNSFESECVHQKEVDDVGIRGCGGGSQ